MLAQELQGRVKVEAIVTSLHGNNDIGELEEFAIVDDIDSDDDDDKSVDQGPLFLGFVVNDPENQSSLLLELFPSKAGGTPTWLEPIHLPSGRAFVCDFCQDPLQFVLQVYAPIDEKEYAYHRTIFVFVCASMVCLRQDQHTQHKISRGGAARSVKVFRCQLPIVNPFYTIGNKSSNGSAKQLECRVAVCSWCNTWKGDQLCSGCRRVRYCSRKHQIMHWRSGHKDHCKQIVSSQSSKTYLCGGDAASAKSQRGACNTLWPEYEIIFRQSNTEMHEINGPESLLQGVDGNNMSVLDYLEGDEGDDDKQCWSSFQSHIAKDPAQVLRCWKEEGRPLWPELRGRPSADNIPNCNYCGGSMHFEFQIMPQLLAFFDVQNEGDSLDWATIAMYTCEASCDSPHVYKEEFPWVQLYQ